MLIHNFVLSFVDLDDLWSYIKSASSSPLYSSHTTPENGIDRNTGTHLQKVACIHSEGTMPPYWWMVEFKEDVEVHKVHVYNRMDCCSERLINTEVIVDGPTLCGQFPDSTGKEELTLECSSIVKTRTLRFENNNQIIQFCEVFIIGRLH